MAQRREYIPTDVKQHIFKFIHATGNFHLFYFQDLRKPLRLTISELISYVAYADRSILEKFQHVLLSFRFREKIRILVAQFGSCNTINWFLSKGRRRAGGRSRAGGRCAAGGKRRSRGRRRRKLQEEEEEEHEECVDEYELISVSRDLLKPEDKCWFFTIEVNLSLFFCWWQWLLKCCWWWH